MVLLLLVPALPPAGAAGTRERWDADRVLRSDIAFPAIVDLEIGPGVNISMEPALNVPDFSPVYLNLSGGLDICGTAERPVAIRSSNESLYLHGDIGGRLTIQGNEAPWQADVRNCSFSNLVLIMIETAGQFRECTFDSCYLYIQDSPVCFVNSTFKRSAVSVYSVVTLNETRLSGCAFLAPDPDRWDPFWESFDAISAIRVSGYAAIDNCTIMGYGTGIESSSGLPAVTGCVVKDCGYGLQLRTTDRDDTPRVEGCVVQNCNVCALSAVGNLLLRNCTLNGSNYGLELDTNIHGIPPGWTLSGNRIFGNRLYGLHLQSEDLDPGDTRFDDGAGAPNLLGRVLKETGLMAEVTTRGTAALQNLTVNLTDAFGERYTATQAGRTGYYFSDLTEYLVDNSGQRRNGFPYLVRAVWNGVSCETAVPGGVRSVTLVMQVLPDLVPVSFGLDPPSPRAGDWLAISCAVNNTGPTQSSRVQALFTLDGESLDTAELFPVEPRSGTSVRAVDWRARRGPHSVTVRLDPENAQEENDESNNNITFNFTVGEALPRPIGGPDIAFAGAATAIVLALACTGGYLAWLRRRKGGLHGPP